MKDQINQVLRSIRLERTRKIELILEKSVIDTKVCVEYVDKLECASFSRIQSKFSYCSISDSLTFFYFLFTDTNKSFHNIFDNFQDKWVDTRFVPKFIDTVENLFIGNIAYNEFGSQWFIGKYVSGTDLISSSVDGFVFVEFNNFSSSAKYNLEDILKEAGMGKKGIFIYENHSSHRLNLWYEPKQRKGDLLKLLKDYKVVSEDLHNEIADHKDLPF